MAIFSSVPPPSQQGTASAPSTAQSTHPIDIESWTVSALESLSVSPSARGTGVLLSIPLDTLPEKDAARNVRASAPKARKEPMRRDSLKRRDALLKGKEGSRRRQRWENDHLLHVPNAQPPLPSDWEVHSTSPVHHVPYYLAPLWENGVRHRAEEIAAARKLNAAKRAGFSANDTKGRVPEELRQKLKRSKGAKSLLQDLEEEVRKFVRDFERKERIRMGKAQAGDSESDPGMDSEDEEIVFVGRNGTMSDEQRKTVEEELEREKMVFDSLADDHGASFARWLVHSIAQYYGLTSRSVTVGNPQRREAWVGIRQMTSGRQVDVSEGDLPRPLWGMI